MAITFVNSSSVAVNAIGATITKPAGVSAGDWMIALVSLDLQQVSIDVASWSPVGYAYDTGGGGVIAGVFKRQVGASEPASYAATWNIACNASVVAVAYSGCDSIDCYNAFGEADSSGTSHTAPAEIATIANTYVLRLWAIINSADIPTTGLTTRVSVSGSSPSPGYGACSATIADVSQALAGTTGTGLGTTTGSDFGRNFTFVIQPPNASPDGPVPPIGAPSTWKSMGQGNSRHSKTVAPALPVSNTPIWTYQRRGSYAYAFLKPIVLGPDGTLWAQEDVDVGDPGIILHAVNQDGTRRLIRTLGGIHNWTPLTVDTNGRVYFVGTDLSGVGALYCYNRDGSVAWTGTYGSGTLGTNYAVCLDGDGNVYSQVLNVGIVSHDPNGIRRWTTNVSGFVGGVNGGLSYDAANQKLYTIVSRSSDNHFLLTQLDTNGNVTASFDLNTYYGDDPFWGSTPVIHGNRIYVVMAANIDNHLTAFDVSGTTLTAAWDHTNGISNGTNLTPSVDSNGNVYILDVNGVSHTGQLTKLDSTGANVWNYVYTAGNSNLTPVVACDSLVTLKFGPVQELLWIDKATGALIDSVAPGSLNNVNVLGGWRQAVPVGRLLIFPGETRLIAYQTYATWHTFGGNYQRNSNQNVPTALGGVSWTYNFPSGEYLYGPPVVSISGYIWAITSGPPFWTFNLYCLNPNGTLKQSWNLGTNLTNPDTNGRLSTVPAYDTCLVPWVDRIRAFIPTDSSESWNYTRTISDFTSLHFESPCVDQFGNIFVAFRDDTVSPTVIKVIKLDSVGAFQSEFDTGYDIWSGNATIPAIDTSGIYLSQTTAPAPTGNVYINKFSFAGALLWQFDAGAFSTFHRLLPPSVHGSVVGVFGANGSEFGDTWLLNSSTGAVIWHYDNLTGDFSNGVEMPAFADDGTVLAGRFNDSFSTPTLYALDAGDGHQLWTVTDPDGRFDGPGFPPVIGNDGYVQWPTQSLSRTKIADGSEISRLDGIGVAFQPAFVTGFAYIPVAGNTAGQLLAYATAVPCASFCELSIAPTSTTVLAAHTQAFTTNQAANFTVTEVGGGTVSPSSGTSTTYTAPTVAGTYHVVAMDPGDPTCFDTATITVPATSIGSIRGVSAGVVAHAVLTAAQNACLEVYFAGVDNGDDFTVMAYSAPTELCLLNPVAGHEYILEAPAADLARFLGKRMGNVKFRRAGAGGNYTGDILLRAIELYYKTRTT